MPFISFIRFANSAIFSILSADCVSVLLVCRQIGSLNLSLKIFGRRANVAALKVLPRISLAALSLGSWAYLSCSSSIIAVEGGIFDEIMLRVGLGFGTSSRRVGVELVLCS